MPDTSPLRPLADDEQAWVVATTDNVLRQLPAATARTGFDDPPDGFLALLRRERP